MCGVFKVLSVNAYVMETSCVTTAVPAAMQVNWEHEVSFPSWAAGRHRLLHDLGVSLATCCPFYTKVARASQQGQALTSLGRSKKSSGGSEAAWQNSLVWSTWNACEWDESPRPHRLPALLLPAGTASTCTWYCHYQGQIQQALLAAAAGSPA